MTVKLDSIYDESLNNAEQRHIKVFSLARLDSIISKIICGRYEDCWAKETDVPRSHRNLLDYRFFILVYISTTVFTTNLPSASRVFLAISRASCTKSSPLNR